MSLDPKQLDETLKNVGERLALLLVASNMPQDVKEAWAALVPSMTLEQLDRFAKSLEQHMAAQGSEELKSLAESIESIKQKSEQAKESSENKALKKLDIIRKTLDAEQE